MASLSSESASHFNVARFSCIALVILLSLLTGCAGSGKPPYDVESYVLSYPAPQPAGLEQINAALKFNRFSVATAYNSSEMIFRKDPYTLDSFNYSRWAVNPADMLADNLLRDARESGLFLAAFSRHEPTEGRFILSGGIEDFYLNMGAKEKTAVIRIAVSLEDGWKKESGNNFIFQRKYFREETLREASPGGYSQAASRAMQIISEQILKDIYEAIRASIDAKES